MHFRPLLFAGLTTLMLAFGTGCQKAESHASSAPATSLSPNTIASVHWLGKRQLGYEATAFFAMRIWNRPESLQLQKKTIDRLATNSWQLLLGGNAGAQIPSAVLHSCFEDLVGEESYLEIRATTNNAATQIGAALARPAVVFAIHVTDGRAGIWETNLGIAMELLTGQRAIVLPNGHGWSLKSTNTFQLIQMNRVGDWTLVSAGPEQNPLADEIAGRVRRDGVPFVSAGTNLWLESSLDLPRLSQVLLASNLQSPSSIFHLPSSISRVNFSVTGDGANVITRAKLTFIDPFAAPLETWRIPVDLMHEPLISFTAVRGVQPLLADWQPWRALEAGAAPDQLFVWSLSGSPYQYYVAAPLPDATGQVAAFTEHLLQKGNPWLAANGYISFDRAPDANGVTWGSLPDIKPFIKSAGNGANGWLFAGLLPETNTMTLPPPAGMINDVLRRTNLVYYDWEITGSRLQPVLSLAQTARLIMRRPQLAMDSAAVNWLAMLVPRLGTSATIASRTGPAELTLYRRSTLGLNAVELQLLAGWLESPAFPSNNP